MERARVGSVVLAMAFAWAAALAGAQATSPEEFARRQYESGLTFLREQRFGEALKDFQAVVDNYPASRVADAALLQIATYQLESAVDLSAAQAAVDLLLKKYPTSDSAPMAHVLAGRLLVSRSRAQPDIEAALSNFERVPRLYPGSEAVPAAYYEAGETLRLTHKDAEAIGRYRQVSLEFPRSPWAARALIGQARCLVATGKPLPAMELLQRVRQRHPGSPEAGTALAWNTILYRLYLRPPAQPAYQAAGRAIPGGAGRLKDIEAVAIDPRGMVVAAGGRVVLSFDPGGRPLPAASANEPVGVAYDRAGTPIFFVKSGVVRGRQAFGLSVPKPDGSPRVLEDVTSGLVTSSGDLLISDKATKAIGRFTVTGKYLGAFAPVPAQRLAIEERGRVAALEQDGAIALLDRDGRLTARIGSRGQGYEFDKLADLAFDPFGHLYALDRGRATLFVFAAEGQPRLVTSVSLVGKGAMAGARKPHAFCLDGAGRLYVYDEDAEKIQVFQ